MNYLSVLIRGSVSVLLRIPRFVATVFYAVVLKPSVNAYWRWRSPPPLQPSQSPSPATDNVSSDSKTVVKHDHKVDGEKVVEKKRAPAGRGKKGKKPAGIAFTIEAPTKHTSEQTITLVKDKLPQEITFESIMERKHINLRMWACISRPQYKYSCGMSSLTAVWNYLFTTLGVGSLPPVTQEEILTILGFSPPFSEIRFGPFTGNGTLIKWFGKLCSHFSVHGKGSYLYKAHGKCRTSGVKPSYALSELRKGLSYTPGSRGEPTAYIYHCHNHYMCPIGFEWTGLTPTDAYRGWDADNDRWMERKGKDGDESDDHANCDDLTEVSTVWMYFGDSSRTNRSMTCVKWDDVVKDIEMQSPKHMNIRHLERGVMERKRAKKSSVGGNLHCLLQFRRFSGGTLILGYDEEEVEEEEEEEDVLDGTSSCECSDAEEASDLKDDMHD